MTAGLNSFQAWSTSTISSMALVCRLSVLQLSKSANFWRTLESVQHPSKHSTSLENTTASTAKKRYGYFPLLRVLEPSGSECMAHNRGHRSGEIQGVSARRSALCTKGTQDG